MTDMQMTEGIGVLIIMLLVMAASTIWYIWCRVRASDLGDDRVRKATAGSVLPELDADLDHKSELIRMFEERVAAHSTPAMGPRRDRVDHSTQHTDEQEIRTLALAAVNAYMAFNLLPVRYEQDQAILDAAQKGLELALNEAIGLDWRNLDLEVKS